VPAANTLLPTPVSNAIEATSLPIEPMRSIDVFPATGNSNSTVVINSSFASAGTSALAPSQGTGASICTGLW
jgi:hypothetical protein